MKKNRALFNSSPWSQLFRCSSSEPGASATGYSVLSTRSPSLTLTPRCWPVTSAAVMLDLMSDVTRILSAIEQGDPHAAEQLLPLVYDELRKLAAAAAGPGEAGPDAPGHRPGPRGLPAAGRTASRPSTGTAAATSSPPRPRPCAASSSRTPAASRRVKHGGGRQRVDLGPGRAVADAPTPDDLLALDEALARLAERRPRGGRAGQAPLLRRPVRRGGRRGPGHLAAPPPTATGPTPAPGCTRAGSAAERDRSRTDSRIFVRRFARRFSHCMQ